MEKIVVVDSVCLLDGNGLRKETDFADSTDPLGLPPLDGLGRPRRDWEDRSDLPGEGDAKCEWCDLLSRRIPSMIASAMM